MTTGDQSDPWFTPVQPEDPWAAPVRAHDSGEPDTADYPTRPPQPATEAAAAAAAATTTYPGTGPERPAPTARPPVAPAPATTPSAVQPPVVPQTRRNRRAVLIGLGVGAAVLVITGWFVPGFLRTRILDVHATEERVTYVLTDPAAGYGLTAVADVVCNSGADPVVRPGATFSCGFTIDGSGYQVEVTTPDKSGVFWVGTPGKT